MPRAAVEHVLVSCRLDRLGGVRRGGCGAADEPGHGGGREVRRRRHDERAADARRGNQPEAGGERAEDRACGVRRVEEPEAVSRCGRSRQRRLHDDGERGPHQGRGQKECEERRREAGGGQRRHRVWQRVMQRAVDHLQRVERPGREQGGGRDQRLGRGEPEQRPADAWREPPGDVAADGQAGHEAREHGAGGVHGDAEHQAEQPQPQQLIDQCARAGQEDQAAQQRNRADPRHAPFG